MEKITTESTTSEVLEELGNRLQRYRLQQNRTMERVAADAGVSLRTIDRAERGGNTTIGTIIRVLRALHRLEVLNDFLPPPGVSPIALAALNGRERKRAGTPRRRRTETPDA